MLVSLNRFFVFLGAATLEQSDHDQAAAERERALALEREQARTAVGYGQLMRQRTDNINAAK